jgi:hypothetical protein
MSGWPSTKATRGLGLGLAVQPVDWHDESTRSSVVPGSTRSSPGHAGPGAGSGQAARMDIYIRILRCALSKNPNVCPL